MWYGPIVYMGFEQGRETGRKKNGDILGKRGGDESRRKGGRLGGLVFHGMETDLGGDKSNLFKARMKRLQNF